MESVKEALLGVARNHPGTLELPEPTVFFESFGDSALNLELVVRSAEMTYRPRRFRSDLNFAIDRAFRERGVEVLFPQRDIHHRTGNPMVRREESQNHIGDVERSTTDRGILSN